MTKVIVVAKIGKDVEVATDPNDFIFHSSYNTFKIIREATKSLALAASTANQSFTDAHGLPFIPVVNAFAKRSGVNQVFAPNGIDVELFGVKLGTVGDVTFNYVKSDATNVIFNFDNDAATTKPITIKYFVLEKVS